MNFHVAPFFRLLLPFALGIAAGARFDCAPFWLYSLLFISAVFTFLIAKTRIRYRYRWAFGAWVSLLFALVGYTYAVDWNELRADDHFSRLPQWPGYVQGVVSDAPSKGARLKVRLRLERAGLAPDSLASCSGNVLLLLEDTPENARFQYGDRIMARATARSVPPPANPHAFDYKRYLHFQNIHYQAFVKNDSVRLLASSCGNSVWQYAFACRARLLDVLRVYFPTNDDYAVASALLVGFKDDLSDEMRTAYAETGSMHALAVSGTHVGLLYAGLLWIFERIRLRGATGRRLRVVFILSAIWAFTFITGATASVMRASLMFTVFLAGKTIRRDASIWNVLSGSAFILLLLNPYVLFDAGFQLSYAAVAGMVFFYPMFYRITPPMHPFLMAGWQVFLVGAAAQLGTLPLSLYYFHQFPVYFWLAGWVVVLGGAIFLWGGALLTVLHAGWPWAAHWVGMLLYGLVKAMNATIFWIQGLPGSLISGVWLGSAGVALLYVAIVCLGLAALRRRAAYMASGLGCLALLSLAHATRAWMQADQKAIVVYAAPKRRLLDLIDGRRCLTLADSLPARQEIFAAQANRWACGIRRNERASIGREPFYEDEVVLLAPCLLRFYDQTVALIDDAADLTALARAVPVDAIVLSGSADVRIADCMERFPAAIVVMDASNRFRQTAQWKAECRALGVAYHDVQESGAWALK